MQPTIKESEELEDNDFSENDEQEEAQVADNHFSTSFEQRFWGEFGSDESEELLPDEDTWEIL